MDLKTSFYKDLLPKAKDVSTTEEFLRNIFGIALEHIMKTFDREEKVIEFHQPYQFEKGIGDFSMDLNGESVSLERLLTDCRNTMKYSVKTGHPRYLNQLSDGLDVVSLAAEWIQTTLNTQMFTFEVAPVFMMMERALFNHMCSKIGWTSGDGLFSPGGTMSNLQSMSLARHQCSPNVKKTGMINTKTLVAFHSSHAHYSICKAAMTLGIGLDNCIQVDVDERGCMKIEDLERKVQQAQSDQKLPFYVCATAGTTVVGAFDPILKIAEVCSRYKMWLHVDAAWGAGALLSSKYRQLMSGVKNADSVTWNPHKMMTIIHQCSTLLVKRRGCFEECNKQNATYLYQPDKMYDSTYDAGDKTMQCGRRPDVLKLWLAWKAKGDRGYEDHVDQCMKLARYGADLIERTPGYELVFPNPQYTNICFWYIPNSVRNIEDPIARKEKLHEVAPKIKQAMILKGSMMIGYQPLDDKPNFFRCILSNPATEEKDIDFMITEIKELGDAIFE